MNVKNNRKSRMTRRIFQETLLELLKTSHITEISVKGLCEAADLNRSTFYSYYQNQMDILHEIEEETYDAVKELILAGIHPDGKTESLMIFERLLAYIREHSELFRVLLSQNGNRDFQRKLMSLTEQAMDVRGVDVAISARWETQYTKMYRIAGCTRVIEYWLDQNCEQPVEEVARMLVLLSAEQ